MKKTNKIEQAERAKALMAGTGRYVFENRTMGDLMLPKAGLDGAKAVRRGGRFEGDSYFFRMVPTELIYVREAQESKEVLLTEQPPTVTRDGAVEYVLERQPPPAAEKLLVDDGSVRIVR